MLRKANIYFLIIFVSFVCSVSSYGADQRIWKLGGVHSVGAPETIGLNKFSSGNRHIYNPC